MNLATDQRAHPEREAHPAPIAIAPVPGESRKVLEENTPAMQNVMAVASAGRDELYAWATQSHTV